MQLPEKQNTIQNEIDNHYSSQQEKRKHLGISIIGEECDRRIWFSFRWVRLETFTGRQIRLFRRGHREEEFIIQDLSVFYKIHSQQKWVNFGCHVSGSIDGIIDDVTKKSHLLEIKTHNDKSFQELKKKGIDSKPVHLIQMNCYGLGLSLSGLDIDRALYASINKNDDEYYFERIHLDRDMAERKIKRGQAIAVENRIPAKISDKPDWYQCKMCSYYDYCHIDNKDIEISCRTCEHGEARVDGNWYCGQHEIPFNVQKYGCKYWVRMYGV